MLDINSLTMREVDMIESLSGQSISSISDDEKPKGKALAALFFIFKFRENPAYTFNQALDEATFGAVNDFFGVDEDDEEEEGKDD